MNTDRTLRCYVVDSNDDAVQRDGVGKQLRAIQKSSGFEEPPLRIFVMGDNVWRSEDSWPLARTDYTKYYLDGARHANSLHGDGRLSTEPPTRPGQDRYVYDPENPVPTLGGPIMHREYAGPHDRRPVERRDDVLCTRRNRWRQTWRSPGR